jgi:hypothetical protein
MTSRNKIPFLNKSIRFARKMSVLIKMTKRYTVKKMRVLSTS